MLCTRVLNNFLVSGIQRYLNKFVSKIKISTILSLLEQNKFADELFKLFLVYSNATKYLKH